MKKAITVSIGTTFDDGAGNSCIYGYTVATKTFTYLAKNHWMVRKVKSVLPTATTLTVAGARSAVIGAPPAAATRTATQAVTGIWTFGASEILRYITMVETLADVEEGANETMSIMAISSQDHLTIASGVDIKDLWTPKTFFAGAETFTVTFTPTVAAVAAGRIGEIAVCTADTDLISREYSGQYVEMGLRAIISALQVYAKEYSGIVTQIENYVSGSESPIALDIPVALDTFVMGVLA